MDDIDALEAERRNLLALAYRMLGTVADAEDAVQETYVRWYRMSEEERAEIINPAAWLTRVAGRVCLDVLGSARVRRESYVGPWLPEPLPRSSPLMSSAPLDPLDRVALDESVSMALLVVLESLTCGGARLVRAARRVRRAVRGDRRDRRPESGRGPPARLAGATTCAGSSSGEGHA